jgi:hypothetical protein
MDGVEVSVDGICQTTQNFKLKGTKMTLGRKNLHVHFFDERSKIALVSPIPVELLLTSELHTFLMPPPLNKYIYPSPLFALHYNGDALQSMTAEEFTSKCDTMKAESNRLAQLHMAIYDVQPMSEIQEEYDDVSDDEICEEDESASEEDEDNSDEWDFEDDDVPVE